MKRLLPMLIALFAIICQSTNIYSAQQARRTLGSLQSGSRVVAVGAQALADLIVGSDNVALGATAGEGLTMGSENIYLNSPAGNQAENGTIRIGEQNKQKSCYISGIYNAQSSGEGARIVVIDANGKLYSMTFDAFIKQLHGLFGQGREGVEGVKE